MYAIALTLLAGCGAPEEPAENQPPVLQAPPDATLEVGDPLQVVLQGSDPDGDALTYQLDDAPAGAGLTAALVQWVPTEDDVGANLFQVSVTDDGEPPLSDVASFVVTVVAPDPKTTTPKTTTPPENHAPVAVAVPDQTVVVGFTLSLTLSASDPDGDPLTWQTDPLPATANLTPDGVFTYTPEPGEVGTYDLVFVVSDDGEPALTSSITVRVVVEPQSYDIVATAIDMFDGLPMPAGFCADLLDPTPMIVGNPPALLDSTVLNASGEAHFAGVVSRPTLGLLVEIDDCPGAGQDLVFPTDTWVDPGLYAAAPHQSTVRPTVGGVTSAQVAAMDVSAAEAGYIGDLTQGGFLFGLAIDLQQLVRAAGVTVACQGCPSFEAYYVDPDPGDGLFATYDVVNASTTIMGLFLVPDAPIAQYEVIDLAGQLTFPPRLVGGIPGRALVVGFEGT